MFSHFAFNSAMNYVESVTLIKKLILLTLSTYCFNDTYSYRYDAFKETLSVYASDGELLKSVHPFRSDHLNLNEVIYLDSTNERVILISKPKFSQHDSFTIHSYKTDLSEQKGGQYIKAFIKAHLVSTTLFILCRKTEPVTGNAHCLYVIDLNTSETKEYPFMAEEMSMTGNDTHLALVCQDDSAKRQSRVLVYSIEAKDFIKNLVKQDVKNAYLSKSRLFMQSYHPNIYRVLDVLNDCALVFYDRGWDSNHLDDVHEFGVIPGTDCCYYTNRLGQGFFCDEAKHIYPLTDFYSKSDIHLWAGPYLIVFKTKCLVAKMQVTVIHLETYIKSSKMFGQHDYVFSKNTPSNVLIVGPYFLQLSLGDPLFLPLPGCSSGQILRARDEGYLAMFFSKCPKRGGAYGMLISQIIEIDPNLVFNAYFDEKFANTAWQTVARHLTNTFAYNEHEFLEAWKALLQMNDPYACAIMFLSYAMGIWGADADAAKAVYYHPSADKKTITNYFSCTER